MEKYRASWYEGFDHVGYDWRGQKIPRTEAPDNIEKFLDQVDNPDAWRIVKNELLQRNVILSKEDVELINRIEGQFYPEKDYDPYQPTVEYFTSKVMEHPLSAAPEPKRRFIPSKVEAKRIMRMVRAIREGRMHKTVPAAKEFYDLWQDEESNVGRQDMINAPKIRLPSNTESYNPPEEYLFTKEEEEKAYGKTIIPKKYSSLRLVPGYDKFVQERFERCMDLYLCPRIQKQRLNIDPETLIPKLPDPKELEPFPKRLAITFSGHQTRVRCVSVDPSGHWVVSGSEDGWIHLWLLHAGKMVQSWRPKEAVVNAIEWNPVGWGFAAAIDDMVVLVNPTIITMEKGLNKEQSAKTEPDTIWTFEDQNNGIILTLQNKQTVKAISWHRKGDYLSTVVGDRTILIHQLSRGQTQRPFRRTQGMVQRAMFHPTKPFLLVATQQSVRIYNLQKQQLVKTLLTGVKWISSMDVHPTGDHLVLSSFDKKVIWFDLDMSLRPFKSFRFHKLAARDVALHPKLPLLASCSDDCQIQVFHAQVYNDLLTNPLLVPVKILRGHQSDKEEFGVFACTWHPTLPWLLSAGADGTVRLWT